MDFIRGWKFHVFSPVARQSQAEIPARLLIVCASESIAENNANFLGLFSSKSGYDARAAHAASICAHVARERRAQEPGPIFAAVPMTDGSRLSLRSAGMMTFDGDLDASAAGSPWPASPAG